MEQGRVEPGTVEKYRIAPWALNVFSCNQEIMGILKTGTVGVDNRIDKIKTSIVIGQVWRPDSAGRIDSPQIKLLVVIQRSRCKLPVPQVTGTVHSDSRKPLKC